MSTQKYIYTLEDFQGARLKYEKTEFKTYLKINIDGFETHEKSNYHIIFSIDNQLFRKLKLKSICNEIKNNSVEDKLLRLINLSKNFIFNEDVFSSSSYSYYYNDYKIDYDIDSNIEDKRQQKQYRKYQSKQISIKTNHFKKYKIS